MQIFKLPSKIVEKIILDFFPEKDKLNSYHLSCAQEGNKLLGPSREAHDARPFCGRPEKAAPNNILFVPGRAGSGKAKLVTPQTDPFKVQTGNPWGGLASVDHPSLRGKIKKRKGGNCQSFGELEGSLFL